MNTDELTLGQIKELRGILAGDCQDSDSDSGPWKVGKKYIIRTVTMIQVGMLKSVGSQELVLSDASWIAYANRYHDTLKDGTFDEVEPFTDDCIVGRGSIVDAQEWHHDLPTEQQ